MKIFSWLFQLLFVLAIFACKKPADTGPETLAAWSGKASPLITNTSLYDTLPGKSIGLLSINELKGIKATYLKGGYTCYFEYEANAAEILKAIGTLPFKRSTEVSDTLPRAMENEFSVNGKKLLSQEEITSSAFFWDIDPRDYEYYECIKAPVRHTILVNKNTGRILHRIESES